MINSRVFKYSGSCLTVMIPLSGLNCSIIILYLLMFVVWTLISLMFFLSIYQFHDFLFKHLSVWWFFLFFICQILTDILEQGGVFRKVDRIVPKRKCFEKLLEPLCAPLNCRFQVWMSSSYNWLQKSN